ncbi:flagellar hook-associated protein 1 FlgK [Desulfotomaculum arcticum]|uniref:Flagellar hook-associated protein 1 n=1 Tax=Desulfotruncus arcticus DSM 17038 TaxID=1121424 RepID=A0A1I2MW79_9FIRM|nr:flagellar hook-associated protein FlgK [Desulfotruncus arcticus]SFF95358.1 flagellar hook-associated protein 1 FlgK [Desulfotomaculum arcticum] [Desulfotruncus arcticus DSM 17038]
MPSTFLGLETARRGLQASQVSLETTGHNIANVNTPGYSRQNAVLVASTPYANPTMSSKLTPGQLGTGVEVNEIRRIRNEYLDTQARDSTSSWGYWQVQEDIFARVEAVFTEPGTTGVGDTLTSFFKAWQDLNNNPQDPGVKAAVAEIGDQLANMFREEYQQLTIVRESAVSQLDSQVNTVNDLLAQIRDVTGAITKVYEQGNQPNDLLDKRDYLIDQLAGFGEVSVENITQNGKPTGEMRLLFNNIDVMSTTDKFFLKEEDDTVAITFGANADNSELVYLNQGKGSLDGINQVLGNIDSYLGQLVKLTDSLSRVINQALNEGRAEADYIDFFQGSLASTNPDDRFRVNPDILANPAGSDAAGNLLIDGTKAIDVARLYSTGIDELDGATFNEFYNALLSDVGADYSRFMDMAENQSAINEQLESLRQSVAGVNMDEELSLMLQYQYGYQASSRVMTTLDALLDHLINRTAV